MSADIHTRSRFAEVGYFVLAFLGEVIFKSWGLNLIGIFLFPTINLTPPRYWAWLGAVLAWRLFSFLGNGYASVLVGHAKEEHRFHSKPPSENGEVAVRVIIAPSPITNPKPTTPAPPDPKPED